MQTGAAMAEVDGRCQQRKRMLTQLRQTTQAFYTQPRGTTEKKITIMFCFALLLDIGLV